MLAEIGVLVEGRSRVAVGWSGWWGADANVCTTMEQLCIWVERDYTEG